MSGWWAKEDHRISLPMFLFVMACVVAVIATGLYNLELQAVPKPPSNKMIESDPHWVPRVPGSNNTPVQVGECGQVSSVTGGQASWHKIECPRSP